MMANISVSELLFDPDFVDPVTVLREVLTVGDDGMGVYAPVQINIVASIQAASGDSLMMSPDMSRTESGYEIITTFPLLTASDATGADIVQWNGRQFRLISVARFDNFQTGFGHYEGMMELMSINPVPTDAQ
jgi:hypothetical protein